MMPRAALLLLVILAVGAAAPAAESLDIWVPTYGEEGLQPARTPEQVAVVLQTAALLTFLTLAPSILILTTCFTRIVIVMSFIRRAVGTQTLPPDQVMVGLSLFLTLFIMAPTWQVAWETGLKPYLDGQLIDGRPMSKEMMFERMLAPQRAFMLSCLEANAGRTELEFFMGVSGRRVQDWDELTRDMVPTHVLIPAFITSELKRAFWMGFLLYLPFLVVDMVIASVLMAMGMMMLPPVMISLPFKIALFVLVDGWKLIMEGIVTSFPVEVVQSLQQLN